MRNFFLPFILMCGFFGISQAELNQYKYIIVPTKFEAFKNENQYQTSTMIKYNLVENGFTAVYDNDLPPDLMANRCLGLLLNLKDDSSMFTTKVTLILKDCQSREVYTTVEGTSKEKAYKTSYSEAIKECFASLSGLGYKYEPMETNVIPAVSFKNDVKKLEGNTHVAPNQNTPNPVVRQKATLEEQSYKNMEPVPSNMTKVDNSQRIIPAQIAYQSDRKGVLYAQAITNGFQLVDSTPKIALKMYATSQANFYIAEGDAHSGVVLKKGEKWYFEYYEGDKLMGQELNIKF